MFRIPEDSLPTFLKDEQRINVLFAPLRIRSVNPKDWDSKISSWKCIIKIYCETNDIYSFTLSSLQNVFIRNGRPPSCLNEVVADMINTGELQVIDVFLKKNSNTWSEWATDLLIKRPLSWSYNKIKNSIFTTSNTNQTYVHLEVVKSKCDILLSAIPNKYKNKLVSLKDLLRILNKSSSETDNIKLLLHSMINHRQIDVTKLNDSNVKDELETFLIKFSDSNKVSPISEIDIGIYTLERNEQLILKSLEALEEEIQNCVKEAKMHISKNHRQMAKISLRKKHELEKRVEKKANALRNVQTLLEQIHETHTDAHVWEAYKNALSAFDTTFKDTGLSEDAIEDTMIKLGDMLDMHEDIQTALARPAQDTNESDLEEELAALLTDDTKGPTDGGVANDLENQMAQLSLNLPDVPDKSPDISIQEVSINQ